ncbi:MAG: bifunctional demethylmenaquinone methyltransferase/2-methoxy-6-polyprenyl-1,4-benzoquinol methylase UbiE [Pirellulales bacterium]|nr:bifunctional demethylmenaquinone methyltransferase/2-methoxy-6-polyprenyl-1,4-benzoquinol methylase UbiE [Pirellulales bacterium]
MSDDSSTMTTVDKTDARVRQMFGEIAPRYDTLNHLLSLGIDRYWRWRTVRLAPPEGESPILDLCTGTGDLALAYHAAAAGRAEIVGADFTHEMLVIARQKGAKLDAAGPRFIEADAQRLPFAENKFQLVSVAFGLRNVADTDRALREMTRVCRHGGRVVVLEFSLPEARLLRLFYGWYFRHVLPRVGQALARNRHGAYNYLPQSVVEFPQGAALAARMKAAGLAEVRYWPLSFGVATLYVGRK